MKPGVPGLFALLLVQALSTALPALAGDGLPTERTDLDSKDRARVEAVTRPTDDFSKAETAQERWDRLPRWKRLAKTIRGRLPKQDPPPAERPHLAVVFQPAAAASPR